MRNDTILVAATQRRDRVLSERGLKPHDRLRKLFKRIRLLFLSQVRLKAQVLAFLTPMTDCIADHLYSTNRLRGENERLARRSEKSKYRVYKCAL